MPPGRDELREILRAARRIAVVGLRESPLRPAWDVARYLQAAGYVIVPVHPAGGVALGEPVHPDLDAAAERAGPIDVVDVFRPSPLVPRLVEPILRVRPRLVWLQVGIAPADVAGRLEAAGIPVVMDRCLKVDHSTLLGA